MKKKRIIERIFDNKLVWAIISLAAATVMWTIVTSNEIITDTVRINDVLVELKGSEELRERAGYIVTGGENQTIWIEVQGNKYDVNKLNNTNVRAVVDLTSVTTVGEVPRGFSIEFDDEVYNEGFKVVAQSVYSLRLTIEKLANTTVPVRARFTGTVAEGYINDDDLDNLPVEPQSLRIEGAQSEIELVREALVTVNRENLDVALDMASTYELVDEDLMPITLSTVRADTDVVNVRLGLSKTRTIPVNVNLVTGGGVAADSDIVTSTVEPRVLEIYGPSEVIDSITKIDLDPIDLASFPLEYEDYLPIKLPEGTFSVTGQVEARVTVSIRDRSTKRISVPSTYFEILNIPDGLDYTIITNNLEVLVRAPESMLLDNGIKANNLRVVVDLKDVTITPGSTSRFTARVHVDGYNEAGAVFQQPATKYEVIISFYEYQETEE